MSMNYSRMQGGEDILRLNVPRPPKSQTTTKKDDQHQQQLGELSKLLTGDKKALDSLNATPSKVPKGSIFGPQE